MPRGPPPPTPLTSVNTTAADHGLGITATSAQLELCRCRLREGAPVDPQIVVGLLVDRTGFPLEIGCFEGNTAETTTIVPIVTSFMERHDLVGTPLVVAADAGMLSGANLKALDELGLSFIVGSRLTKAPGDLESHFHWNGDVFTDGQIIDTVTPRHGNTKVNNPALRAEPVWDREAYPGAWRAIWSYSAKRARRDQKTLAAQEARARAIVDRSKKAKTARFVKVRGDDRAVDEASLARAQSLVGLKGYVTNVPATLMPATEVIAKYHDLWRVEKSFRMSKSDLDARPMFNRVRDTIEAHLTIVFTALAVAHAIQSRTGLSTGKVVKALRPLRSATININGATQTFPPQFPGSAQNPHRSRLQTRVLSEMSKLRFHRGPTNPRAGSTRPKHALVTRISKVRLEFRRCQRPGQTTRSSLPNTGGSNPGADRCARSSPSNTP